MSDNVTYGENVFIDQYCNIGAPNISRQSWNDAGVRIGNNVKIGSHVTIVTGINRPTTIGDNTIIKDKVHIDHDTIIGSNCDIMACAHIGSGNIIEDNVKVWSCAATGIGSVMKEGSQLGMCSYLRGTAKRNMIYVGIPAKALRPKDPILNRLEYFILHKLKLYIHMLYVPGKRGSYNKK